LPAPPVSVSLPAPPKRFARGRRPLLSSNAIVSLPFKPNAWIRLVLATVGVPPLIATAPPLTWIEPVASRLITLLLSFASPVTVPIPAVGLKRAVTAGITRVSRDSKPDSKSAGRRRLDERRLKNLNIETPLVAIARGGA